MTDGRLPQPGRCGGAARARHGAHRRVADPLRDEGGWSAITRPQWAVHYENADLVRQAACWQWVSQAQAFIDGNKRTAFAASDVFLRLNRLVFRGDPVTLARKLEAVATRAGDLGAATAEFEAWLRGHTQPVER
ncbi:MAG: type II toxin-antitoxin system death-on-curing family toxin [Anaerolineae bacterium]|nr:type II toxin-antitoxin system death-on-curing family toxin [Anaerolineae bacterium]